MNTISWRRWILGAVSIIAILFWSFALAAQTPEQIVRSTTEEVLSALKKEKEKGRNDPGAAERVVSEKILPVIDFKTFAKLTLGMHWRKATPEQRERFSQEFQSMLIRTYARYMLDYTDTKVNYLPTRTEEKYTFVKTELVPGQGKTPLHVTYRFKQFGDAWKAIDVTVDGLSMAKNFRTSFVDEVNQTSLDALIERLSKTNSSDSDLLPSKPASGGAS